jgi:phenylalanyl-tRNA synthetase beta chain
MDIKILDSWLKDYLETKAKPSDLVKCLSLCGPSVEKVEKFGADYVYDIEVTTNRIDSASVYGIAREGAAILPRFKIVAKLKKIKNVSAEFKFVKKVNYLNAIVDPKLCRRFTAVLIKNVKIGDSPEIVKKRLE